MKLLLILSCLFGFLTNSYASDSDYVKRNELIPPTKLNHYTEVNQIYLWFNKSTAVDLCMDKKADLIVEGGLWKYRMKRNGDLNSKHWKNYRYSSLPTSDVQIGCKDHKFFVSLYKKVPVRNANGEIIKYELVPQDTNVHVGNVDENCHLTIDPRIDILKPNLRLIVAVANHHNGRMGFGDNVSYSLTFDCSLINEY